MVNKVKAFARFWYDFVIGDDWRVAAGVCFALAVTYLASRSATATWWIVPAAVSVLLPYSLWRVVRPSRRRGQ